MEKLLLEPSRPEISQSPTSIYSNFESSHDKLIFNTFKDWAIENVNLHKALQPFEIIPSGSTEKEVIVSHLNELKKGYNIREKYFVISANWLEAWKEFVKFKDEDPSRKIFFSIMHSLRPVEIDNEQILDFECHVKLRDGLVEHQDYEIVSKAIWNDFEKWYGGGPEIKREALLSEDEVIVDVYPPVFKIFIRKQKNSRLAKHPEMVLGKLTKTISWVMGKLKKHVNSKKEYALYLITGENLTLLPKNSVISTLKLTGINTCRLEIADNPQINQVENETYSHGFNESEVVEYNHNNYWMPGIIQSVTMNEIIIKQTWQNKLIKMSSTNTHKLRKPAMTFLHSKSKSYRPGLINLGNTCYMNSILQCLFYTPLVNEYFLGVACKKLISHHKDSQYKALTDEIVKLCEEVAERAMPKIKPTDFLLSFLAANKSFEKGTQHDCHEFLVVILNNLHEILCRDSNSMQKTITLKMLNDAEEISVSKDQWDLYRGTKGSVISAVFGSQTKNIIVCTKCDHKKSIYEVFNYFSLPIPVNQKDINLSFRFVQMSNNLFQKFLMKIDSEDQLEKVLEKFENLTQTPKEKLMFGFIKKNLCEHLFFPDVLHHLLPNGHSELFIFEVISSIESAEGLGKTTLPKKWPSKWRQLLQPGDLVDVKIDETWKVAHIKELTEETCTVTLHQKAITKEVLSLYEENLQPYRSFTTSINKILYIPISQLKLHKISLTIFGTPQVLSIGCWYTWQDLLEELQKIAILNTKLTDTHVISKKLQFYIYKKPDRKCLICLDIECKGCEIKASYETLEQLCQYIGHIYIFAYWVDEKAYKDAELQEEKGDREAFDIHQCFAKLMEEEKIEMTCENCGNKTHNSVIELWKLPDKLKGLLYSDFALQKIQFPWAGPEKNQ